MKEWFSSSEIASVIGCHPRSIKRTAEKSDWKSRKRMAKGGGNEYHISSLPRETQAALMGVHHKGIPEASDSLAVSEDDAVAIPIYDVEASAGYGSVVETENVDGQMFFSLSWLKRNGLNSKRMAIITAIGDSMQPTINDRDHILLDTSVAVLDGDGIYAIIAGGHLLLKRICIQLDGSHLVISDNPKYPPQAVAAASEIKIAGKARLRISRL